eukprot:4849387-Amphidinium_carterae.1
MGRKADSFPEAEESDAILTEAEEILNSIGALFPTVNVGAKKRKGPEEASQPAAKAEVEESKEAAAKKAKAGDEAAAASSKEAAAK